MPTHSCVGVVVYILVISIGVASWVDINGLFVELPILFQRLRVSVVVYILVILFGVASWVDINGLFVELPILVQRLPEGWSLPSYMVVLTQAANIGPLLYFLFSIQCSKHHSEKAIIFSIIATNIITCVLITFLWQQTTLIAGAYRSAILFALYFILALVDCTSSLVFYPFMGNFKPSYMTAYFIGEGFSALLPGVLSLVQGAGRMVCRNVTTHSLVSVNGTIIEEELSAIRASYGQNLFSFEVFYSIICVVIIVSGISFTLLAFHPVCKKEQVITGAQTALDDIPEEKGLTKQNCNDDQETLQDTNMMPVSNEEICTDESNMQKAEEKTGKKIGWYIPIVILTGWVNCMKNSVLLAVQSYSCLPYGTTQYHLTVTLVNVANPLASLVVIFINVTSVPGLSMLSFVGSVLAAYIMATAVMSPTPILVGTVTGSVLIVAVWVVCMFLFTYAKVCLASLFRTEGKKGLLYLGAATQVGSAIGGLVMFVLVNVLSLFQSIDPCFKS